MDKEILYDDTESVSVRFVGFFGESVRFDLAIAQTDRFFGKRLVCSLQSGRFALLDAQEAAQADYLSSAFAISLDEARELGEFLELNL